MERGAKVSGARFYFLKGVGMLLQLGMLQLADPAGGGERLHPDDHADPGQARGDGRHRLPVAHDDVYRLDDPELYLTGTSEVALAGYHMDEILDLSNGPIRYAGWSSCYRNEAGSHGKDTRGIIRVHQFDKVEMFSYCSLEDAAAEHQRLLGWEKQMLDKMELTYRVIDTATGDLGALGVPEVRLRGVGADPGRVPRAHLDVELHRLPGPPAEHPAPRRRRQDAAGRDAERDAGHHPVDRRDPGDAPAGGRLGPGADGAAAVRRRPRGPRTGQQVSDRRRRPTAVALDIDGTLIDHDERLSPAVVDAVRRAAAQVPVILATGRAWYDHQAGRRALRPAARIRCREQRCAHDQLPGRRIASTSAPSTRAR